ncbi:hypothetical protein E2C01_022997 [Portunus trituberculatus]|uniref:Uncharacterized protein n=1 Tax=Portunus trituberculatus TaxID=210409 RepID=A0A5B7E7M9_PORTR|nr:hypothetical protein [Portunus trituberculatus]
MGEGSRAGCWDRGGRGAISHAPPPPLPTPPPRDSPPPLPPQERHPCTPASGEITPGSPDTPRDGSSHHYLTVSITITTTSRVSSPHFTTYIRTYSTYIPTQPAIATTTTMPTSNTITTTTTIVDHRIIQQQTLLSAFRVPGRPQF